MCGDSFVVEEESGNGQSGPELEDLIASSDQAAFSRSGVEVTDLKILSSEKFNFSFP